MNVRALILGVLLVTVGSWACTQPQPAEEAPAAADVAQEETLQSSSSEPESALTKQVIEVEQAWAAALEACDTDVLASLITDDFSFTDYNGMTYSRHWFLETSVPKCARNVVRIEPMQITFNDGDNAAIVMSRYHQFINDTPEPVHQLQHVLVRHGGTWQVAHHHSAIMQDIGPEIGKAFAQLGEGASTRKAPVFEPQIARYSGDVTKNPPADRVASEKEAVYTALKYVNLFQNCRTAHLEDVMSEGYLISGYNGMTYTRQWMVDASDACYHDLQRIEPLQIRLYGDNTAVLLGRYHQYVGGQPYDLRHITVTLFREEGGAWRVAHHYSTTFNEYAGSNEGKLFFSVADNSTIVSLPTPNWVVHRPLLAPEEQPWMFAGDGDNLHD